MGKILIVEDDTFLQNAYKTKFLMEGFEVETASDGKEGLKKAIEFNPKVIILDLMMPIMSGIEFLKEYKPKEQHPDVIVLVFSNDVSPNQIQEAIELGAKKYLMKAMMTPNEIVKQVNDLLK